MGDSDHATNRAHCPGGMVFHVLNHANARASIFAKDEDYAAFEPVMKEKLEKKPMRIPGFPWPERDGELASRAAGTMAVAGEPGAAGPGARVGSD